MTSLHTTNDMSGLVEDGHIDIPTEITSKG